MLTLMPSNPIDLELDILLNCFNTKYVDISGSVNKVLLLTFSLIRILIFSAMSSFKSVDRTGVYLEGTLAQNEFRALEISDSFVIRSPAIKCSGLFISTNFLYMFL